MAVALMLNSSSHRGCSLSVEDDGSLQLPSSKNSYYKFYQFKIKQTTMENQQQHYQDMKRRKAKQVKQLSRKKQSYKDYMNHVREKLQQQPDTSNDIKDGEGQRRSSSTLSIINQRNKDFVSATVKSTSTLSLNIITNESKQKICPKTRKAPIPIKNSGLLGTFIPKTKPKQNKLVHEPWIVDTETVRDEDEIDDALFYRPSGHIYKEVASSSALQIEAEDNVQLVRQSMLHSLMLHLHEHPPESLSKWDIYRDYGDRISASISDTTYRNFERVFL